MPIDPTSYGSSQLWVVDITCVRTWQGFAYTEFVTDACTRVIVGWHVAATIRTELIRQRRPWRTVEQVGLATCEWVWWYNQQRLHEALDYQPPTEFEAALNGASAICESAAPALATT
ncbi:MULTISPECIES: integrase core domain-containing protein [Gordonia]|uniref:Integrase catalytic domain-containing protein n=4 Tax=Gordonia TaxID=2053 RepID=A0ABQ0HNG6_GORRU|nr:hypothetical protein GCWB2_21290 [Gordonia rubripertincta]EON30395.1 integrase core domain-containing protein [Gordonia terrae C-6]MBD0024521.1 transposase [Gordonia sp. (in: high G+C Gram-positive bacteria)]NKY05370.1 transposase [Gordonia polyisoprenivorans]OBC12215.1 hypothetical protein A5786_03110 [Gordonia sp. 852002-50816_SCH5313054-a]OBC21822.1 hypothetical protein A5788_03945 [Gordonia sp. 852002-50816_SCH5313054-c]QHN27870.1 transposase [Gordonia pseudamarae]UAK36478.1 integrase